MILQFLVNFTIFNFAKKKYYTISKADNLLLPIIAYLDLVLNIYYFMVRVSPFLPFSEAVTV